MNSSPMNASEVLERWFLETRSKLLDIAANLDRIDRAPGGPVRDPRRAGIDEALRVLLGPGPERAEKVQMIFSREYEPDWIDDAPLGQAPKGK